MLGQNIQSGFGEWAEKSAFAIVGTNDMIM